LVATYRELIAGRLAAQTARKTLTSELRAMGGYGVVSGSLRVIS
jgi:hypothetical protein